MLGVLLGLKLGGGVLRLQPSASLMNVIIIGLLFASCTSMLRGGGEAAGGLGLTLALLALEAGWIGACRLAFTRRHPPPPDGPARPSRTRSRRSTRTAADGRSRRSTAADAATPPLAAAAAGAGGVAAAMTSTSGGTPAAAGDEESESDEELDVGSFRVRRLSDVGLPIDGGWDDEEEGGGEAGAWSAAPAALLRHVCVHSHRGLPHAVPADDSSTSEFRMSTL